MLEFKTKPENRQSLLHNATRKILFVFYIVGLFPVKGLLQKNPDKLKFELKSFVTLIFIPLLVVNIISGITHFYYLTISELSVTLIVDVARYVMRNLRLILILKLSYQWPKLIETTLKKEKELSNDKKKVQKLCNIVFYGFNISNLINFATSTWFKYKLATVCSVTSSKEPSFKNLVLKIVSKKFIYFGAYTEWKGVLMLVYFWYNVYFKDALDILFMQISIYLTSYFDDFHKTVKNYAKQYKGRGLAWTIERPALQNINWSEMRNKHTKMVFLVKILNEKLSGLIFLSFGIDLINLWTYLPMLFRRGMYADPSHCDQSELRPVWTEYNYTRTIFIYYSIFHIVIRFFFVSYLAATLHTVYKKPELHLYEINEKVGHNLEVERLITRIRSSTVALNGLGFFNVTKGMILNMVGVIITYQMMVIQFASNFSTLRYSTIANYIQEPVISNTTEGM